MRRTPRLVPLAFAVVVLAAALAACEGDTIVLPPEDMPDAAGPGPTDAHGGSDARRSDTGDPLADVPPGRDTRPPVGSDTPVGSDEGSPRDTGAPPAPDVPVQPTCRANDDGIVSRDEVVIVLGAVATYVANRVPTSSSVAEIPVDTDGTPDPEHPGQLLWDFSEGPRDVVRGVVVDAMPADAWYAEHFEPPVTYVTPLGIQPPEDSILGVFRLEDDRLSMLGIASREAGPGRTLLVYDEPVVLYRFPLHPPRDGEAPQQWSQTVSYRNAILSGSPQAGRETYRFTVDGVGTVVLRDFTFTSVLRIRLDLEQYFALSRGTNTFHHIRYFWFTECVGEVARVVGPLVPDDPPEDVPLAFELRRLGF